MSNSMDVHVKVMSLSKTVLEQTNLIQELQEEIRAIQSVWCEEHGGSGQGQDCIKCLKEEAWGLIANAYGGDWELASEASGWKKAAERWRDKYL